MYAELADGTNVTSGFHSLTLRYLQARLLLMFETPLITEFEAFNRNFRQFADTFDANGGNATQAEQLEQALTRLTGSPFGNMMRAKIRMMLQSAESARPLKELCDSQHALFVALLRAQKLHHSRNGAPERETWSQNYEERNVFTVHAGEGARDKQWIDEIVSTLKTCRAADWPEKRVRDFFTAKGNIGFVAQFPRLNSSAQSGNEMSACALVEMTKKHGGQFHGRLMTLEEVHAGGAEEIAARLLDAVHDKYDYITGP